MRGIYYYIDLKTNEIIYIGKDSNIHKNRRHNDHMNPRLRNQQQINRVLQNNPNRYEYKIFIKGNISENLLISYEKVFICMYAPLFNFTKGGEGLIGFKHTDETKRKISESLKGNKLSFETKIKQSRRQNTTGYFRVTKKKSNTCTQGYIFSYMYYDDKGNRKSISSTCLDVLKRKVLDKGLEWQKIKEVI